MTSGVVMKWTVIDTFACPRTGMAFSGIVSMKMIKLIIWYNGDVIIPAGATIEPVENGIKIDGVFTEIVVFNICTFRQSLWLEMKEKIKCPWNEDNESAHCFAPVKCALKSCPYGKKQFIATNID